MHNIHPPEEFSLDIVLGYLPKDFFDSPTAQDNTSSDSAQIEINRVAIMMAVFGWTARLETKVRDGAAVCESCFRTLGLWLFKSKVVNEAGEVVRGAAMNYLDLVEQHREYCPWRNPKSQSGGGVTNKSIQASELAAWQVVVRVLKNDHRLRHGSSDADKDKTRAPAAVAEGRPETALAVDITEDDAESIREEKDKERWARLRRVRSLFDTKAAKKLQRNSHTPDTKGKGLG